MRKQMLLLALTCIACSHSAPAAAPLPPPLVFPPTRGTLVIDVRA